MEFEKLHGGYDKIKILYNRATHALKDASAFEEQFNLLQVKGHLWRVWGKQAYKTNDSPFANTIK